MYQNVIDFIKDNDENVVQSIIDNAPEWAEKYNFELQSYHRRSKQLSYNRLELNIDDLIYGLKEKEIGRKLTFKERQELRK